MEQDDEHIQQLFEIIAAPGASVITKDDLFVFMQKLAPGTPMERVSALVDELDTSRSGKLTREVRAYPLICKCCVLYCDFVFLCLHSV